MYFKIFFTRKPSTLKAPFTSALAGRWHGQGGYRELLTTAFPLILSTGSWSLQTFIDRVFLSWYSPETIAASMPAGLLQFTVMSVFIGTCSYAGTFVAQYYGAGLHSRIGKVIWQGLYLSVIGGAIILLFYPLAPLVFRNIGHAAVLQPLEISYFQILCLGGLGPVASGVLAGFFSGLGKNWPVMWANLLATLINIVLDYVWIFGHAGFPEMGISGAAWATVIAGFFPVAYYLVLILSDSNEKRFATRSAWRIEPRLIRRLLVFGLPSGIQFFIDIAGFSLFLLVIGRLGMTQLAATNIAFNINTVAFMPMLGTGIAISMLVGQYLGDDKPELAQRSVYSGFHLTFLYMGIIAASYVVVPQVYIWFFSHNADPATFGPIADLSKTLLKFVAFYSLFDTMTIVFSMAVKGAGDTRFVMTMMIMLSICALVVPTFIAVVVFHRGIYTAWIIGTAYIILCGFAFLVRFLSGAWKTMRVIEENEKLLKE
jgi:MATE family multidrug resistance protein